MRETIGVVHILIAGEAAEYRLPQQASQLMAGVSATTAFRQHAPGQAGQPERVVQFPVSQQAGVGGDAGAVELQPQAAVDIDPQGVAIRFTRGVVHRAVIEAASTHSNYAPIPAIRASEIEVIREIRNQAAPRLSRPRAGAMLRRNRTGEQPP